MTTEQLPERIPFGMERDAEESPCPGCGVYYFDHHQPGCEYEECPVCGGQIVGWSANGLPILRAAPDEPSARTG